MKIVYDPNSLCHYGVLGMKWGRRKSKAKSSGKKASKKTKKDKSSNREKILTDVRKQKIKAVAKTTAKVAGKVAVVSLMGYVGAYAMSEIGTTLNNINREVKDLNRRDIRETVDEQYSTPLKDTGGYKKVLQDYVSPNGRTSYSTYKNDETGKYLTILRGQARIK